MLLREMLINEVKIRDSFDEPGKEGNAIMYMKHHGICIGIERSINLIREYDSRKDMQAK
ncbi:MAG: hypothetical protein KBD83_07520 [Gammaproteobacteria bacterium]|nr:hypothetical protein [Gammaproteobacteria bacterium]